MIQTYTVTVDYGKTLESMVENGKYDYFNEKIIEIFLVNGDGTVEVDLELVHLNKQASTNEVKDYLEANGLRPATLEEILAFGAKYPEIQREFPIIALGPSNVYRNAVPFLGSDRFQARFLILDSYDLSPWTEICRFLAVRK